MAEPQSRPRVLVVNSGSSSLKLNLLEGDALLESASLPAVDEGAEQQIRDAIDGWSTPDVVAHRVVHGGPDHAGPARLDDRVRHDLRRLSTLAPLHQPLSLAAIEAVDAVLPDVEAYACFDTAFHRTLDTSATTYPVPWEWREHWGVRRYGFHGLSHAYCASRAADLAGREVDGLRVVTCHLGAGASLAAVVSGRSVDTTMGFTPLEGVMMATRSGSVDPGLVLWLEEQEHLDPRAVAEALERRSGFAALAGSSDIAHVVARANEGDERARLAVDVCVRSIVRHLGAMITSARGLDVLAFTGGVGENSASIRARVCDELTWLGVRVDAHRDQGQGDRMISDPGGDPVVVVVHAREDLQMAHQVSRAREACS